MPKPSAPHRVLVQVIESERLPHDHHRLVLRAPDIAREAQPGQFLHIWCHPPDAINRPPCAAILRRPYSISRLHPTDDVEILLRVRGVGGQIIASKSPGEQLDVLGPLGHGFHLPPDMKTAVVVAGGSGLAPVPFLVMRLIETGARVICLFGATTDDAVPFKVERPRAGRAVLTDIEVLGAEVSFVSEAVEGIVVTQIVELRLTEFGDALAHMFAIGPRAMLKRLDEVTGVHIPLQISLEERMACGVGACRSCVVPVRSEHGRCFKTVCRDGPVFNSSEIDWERIEP